MSDHVDPEALFAFVDGRLSHDAEVDVRARLDACAHCKRRYEDLVAVRRATLGRFDGAGESTPDAGPPPAWSEAQDDAFAKASRRAAFAGAARKDESRRPRAGFGIRRFAPWLGAAAAAALFVAYVGPFGSGDRGGEGFGLRGVVAFETSTTVVRAENERTYRFEIVLDRPAYVVVVRVVEGEASILYPDPNPSLGTYGVDGALPAGKTLRIPPTPTLDPVLRAEDPTPEFVALAFAAAPDARTLDDVRAIATNAAPRGADAVRAALAARYPGAARLAAR